MSKHVLPYLQHIADECSYLGSKVPGIESYETFIANEDLKRAFVRSLEIIGEATKNIDKDYLGLYPGIPWREMAAMRDKLIHGYFGINYLLVWDVVKNRIPVVYALIVALIEEENNKV